MSAQKQKFEPALQEVADKILHDLPEEIAMGVSFKLHEGGDALVLVYPLGLHGSPEMQLLDGVVHRYGGAFVSRGKGDSYYLVPKPKPKLPAVLANEATKQREKAASETSQVQSVAAPVAVSVSEGIQKDELKQPPTSSDSSNSQSAPVPKQPSPKTLFNQKYCVVCADSGFCSSDESLRLCIAMLKLQALEALVASVEKLASRPSYRSTRYSAKQLPVERHVEGDIKWLTDKNQKGEPYEKALKTENQASQAYAALEKMLSDAATAGKKGLLLEGKWHFLSTQRDWIGRKLAKEFPQRGQ